MKTMTHQFATTADHPRNPLIMTNADIDRLEKVLRGVEGPQNSLFPYAEALRSEMNRAQVVPQHEVPTDVVTMNSRVKVRDLKTRKLETHLLAYPCDAGFFDDGLSVLAPIGTALLGTRVGDVVSWPVPGGTRTLRIEEVLFQPEAAGKYEL